MRTTGDSRATRVLTDATVAASRFVPATESPAPAMSASTQTAIAEASWPDSA